MIFKKLSVRKIIFLSFLLWLAVSFFLSKVPIGQKLLTEDVDFFPGQNQAQYQEPNIDFSLPRYRTHGLFVFFHLSRPDPTFFPYAVFKHENDVISDAVGAKRVRFQLVTVDREHQYFETQYLLVEKDGVVFSHRLKYLDHNGFRGFNFYRMDLFPSRDGVVLATAKYTTYSPPNWDFFFLPRDAAANQDLARHAADSEFVKSWVQEVRKTPVLDGYAKDKVCRQAISRRFDIDLDNLFEFNCLQEKRCDQMTSEFREKVRLHSEFPCEQSLRRQ